MRHIFLIINILLSATCCFDSGMAFSQKKKKVEILNSDILLYERHEGASLKRLIGNVALKHEDVIMYCDSAYLFDDRNLVEAYNNVHIIQGDTLNLYGDFLKYRGDVRIAEFRRNVIMIDKQVELRTEFLDYNLNDDLGYYFNGGVIHNEQDTLKSRKGYYYAKQELFHFKDSVVILNPDFIIYSDTLKYNVATEISYFLGPTQIFGDSSYAYCENGWYNSQQDISQFKKNAYLVSKGQTIIGDSLYYDNLNGFGRAFSNVVVIDSAESVMLKGNYGIFHENPERAMVTDSAIFIQFAGSDSLFVHADTMRSRMDSTNSFRIMMAFYHVKIFGSEIQGKCDSLSYSFRDSVIRLFGQPVLWSEENQLTSEYMEIHTRNEQVEHIELYQSAFIISQEDSTRFNQIKGKDMVGYFREGELYRINVFGNGQTIYYAKEDNEIIGVNSAESSDMVIYLENKKVRKINFIKKPDGILNPLGEVPDRELRLKNFSWQDRYRPRSKLDIFEWN